MVLLTFYFVTQHMGTEGERAGCVWVRKNTMEADARRHCRLPRQTVDEGQMSSYSRKGRTMRFYKGLAVSDICPSTSLSVQPRKDIRLTYILTFCTVPSLCLRSLATPHTLSLCTMQQARHEGKAVNQGKFRFCRTNTKHITCCLSINVPRQ